MLQLLFRNPKADLIIASKDYFLEKYFKKFEISVYLKTQECYLED